MLPVPTTEGATWRWQKQFWWQWRHFELLAGQQNGIHKTNAFGINYSDIWGKKLTVTGNYFFNNTNNTTSEHNHQPISRGSVIMGAQ